MKLKVTMLENGLAMVEIEAQKRYVGTRMWVFVYEPQSSINKQTYLDAGRYADWLGAHIADENGRCVFYVDGRCDVHIREQGWAGHLEWVGSIYNIVQEEAA